ncbi:DUF2974 domain-containing protein, partial [Massilia sp. BJB1822]|nr:DUF2974 domain-containing protein [Massilia sp. BJB1822]
LSGTDTQSNPTVYVVQRDGENLGNIAKAVWGDERLWYMIAQANGLTGNEPLKAGQPLTIPVRLNTIYNGANTFEPYNAGELVGSTTPELAIPQPAAPAPKKGKCGGVGQLIIIVVAVVATVMSAGAAASALASASGVTGGAAGLATTVAGAANAAGLLATGASGLSAGLAFTAGAIGGAVGSIASQAVGMALGVQDKFSWKGVALSALGGGASAGVASLGAGGSLGAVFAGAETPALVARAALSSVASQAIGNAIGLQSGFNWRNVAAAAAGAAVGSTVGKAMEQAGAFSGLRSLAGLARGTVSGFAAGATAAIARGGKIEIARIATDAFGNALGNSLADTLSTEEPTGVANSARKPGSMANRDRQQRAFDALLKASGSETVAKQYMQQYADLIDDTSGILDFGSAAAAPDAKYLVRPSDPEQASAYDKVLHMVGKTPADAWLTAKDVAIRQRADSIELEIDTVQRTDSRRAETLRNMHQEMVFGLLNRDVYFQNEISELMPRGWGRVTVESDLRAFGISSEILIDKDQGYFGALYRNKNTETYVYANRGTDERIDWAHNFLQSVGKSSSQYERAIEIARRLKSSEIAAQLTFTGHSLGGGLASAQSIVTGIPGITFNAAGLNPATVAPYGPNLMTRAPSIRAYYVQGELLSTMQDSGATVVSSTAAWLGSPLLGVGSYAALSRLPKATGLRVALDAVGDPVKMGSTLAPGNAFTAISPTTSLDLHGMSNVLNSLYRRIATTAQPGWFIKWN